MNPTEPNPTSKFMAVIHISGLSIEEVVKVMPHEDAIVRDLMNEGTIESLYVRGDLGGAFIVGKAESVEAYRTALMRLPLYPHMTIEFVPLFDMPAF